jgi:hypothetical protein
MNREPGAFGVVLHRYEVVPTKCVLVDAVPDLSW